jgi:hypothetical protein
MTALDVPRPIRPAQKAKRIPRMTQTTDESRRVNGEALRHRKERQHVDINQ